MLHCLSVSGCLSVRRHVHYPGGELEGSLLSQPFLTPILELWDSWFFFGSWSRKLCFQKKLSTFLLPSTIVFEGFAILPSRTPANIFQAANQGTYKPITCSRSQKKSVMVQDVKAGFLSVAVLCRTVKVWQRASFGRRLSSDRQAESIYFAGFLECSCSQMPPFGQHMLQMARCHTSVLGKKTKHCKRADCRLAAQPEVLPEHFCLLCCLAVCAS